MKEFGLLLLITILLSCSEPKGNTVADKNLSDNLSSKNEATSTENLQTEPTLEDFMLMKELNKKIFDAHTDYDILLKIKGNPLKMEKEDFLNKYDKKENQILHVYFSDLIATFYRWNEEGRTRIIGLESNSKYQYGKYGIGYSMFELINELNEKNDDYSREKSMLFYAYKLHPGEGQKIIMRGQTPIYGNSDLDLWGFSCVFDNGKLTNIYWEFYPMD